MPRTAVQVSLWSTTGGDLRIPHFIGLHAFQFLPLVAFLLRDQVSEPTRVRLVWTAKFGFLGLLLLTLWQALRAQPMLEPDALTLAAAALLAAGIAIAATAALREAH